MYLGDLIKKYRTENNISQRDFAKLCNLSHTYIAALEKNIDPRTGKPIAPTLDTVKYVSNAMNMTIENILHLLEDNQEFTINKDAPKYSNATYNTLFENLDIEGLDENDLIELREFIEFKKNLKKNKKRKIDVL